MNIPAGKITEWIQRSVLEMYIGKKVRDLDMNVFTVDRVEIREAYGLKVTVE